MIGLKMDEFKYNAVIMSIKQMFTKTYFDICILRELLEVLGREHMKSSEDYKTLSLLHCTHWANMPPEMVVLVKDRCLKILDIKYEESPKPDIRVDKKVLVAPNEAPWYRKIIGN